ncbi:MAG: hypothetical protein MI725_14175 [Pirellulales bacterium]|nr:hypothetical protein [Pirellulales bacterium]
MKPKPDGQGSPCLSFDGLEKGIKTHAPSLQSQEVQQLRTRLMKLIIDNEQARKAKSYYPIHP